jgi:hypothetical protein
LCRFRDGHVSGDDEGLRHRSSLRERREHTLTRCWTEPAEQATYDEWWTHPPSDPSVSLVPEGFLKLRLLRLNVSSCATLLRVRRRPFGGISLKRQRFDACVDPIELSLQSVLLRSQGRRLRFGNDTTRIRLSLALSLLKVSDDTRDSGIRDVVRSSFRGEPRFRGREHVGFRVDME